MHGAGRVEQDEDVGLADRVAEEVAVVGGRRPDEDESPESEQGQGQNQDADTAVLQHDSLPDSEYIAV